MILCVCRNISDRSIKAFIEQNAHMLSESWKNVSEEVSREKIKCSACKSEGTACLDKLRVGQQVAGGVHAVHFMPALAR